MPVIVDVEKRARKKVEGTFKISGKGVNLWG